jgi:hypothetical protein
VLLTSGNYLFPPVAYAVQRSQDYAINAHGTNPTRGGRPRSNSETNYANYLANRAATLNSRGGFISGRGGRSIGSIGIARGGSRILTTQRSLIGSIGVGTRSVLSIETRDAVLARSENKFNGLLQMLPANTQELAEKKYFVKSELKLELPAKVIKALPNSSHLDMPCYVKIITNEEGNVIDRKVTLFSITGLHKEISALPSEMVPS